MRRIKNTASRLWNSEFLRGIVLLSSGSAISQFAVFLASPVLARLYGAGDFGIYALFSSVVNIVAQVVCMKYDLAIPLSSDEEQADRLFQAAAGVSVAICLVSIAGLSLARIAENAAGGNISWLYLLPAAILSAGMQAAFTGYRLRNEQYARIAAAAVLRGMLTIMLQIGFGVAGLGGVGMALGQVLSCAAGCLALGAGLWSKLELGSWKLIGWTARQYGGFPRYTAVGSLANAGTYNLTSFLLAAFYSPAQLGLYSLASRILSAPLTILTGAVSQTYLQYGYREKQEKGDDKGAFRRTSGMLFLAAAVLFGFLYGLLPKAIAIVYGEQWSEAGRIARILLPLYLARFVVTPLSSSAVIRNKLSAVMWWQICLLLLSVLPAGVHLITPLPIYSYLGMMSAGLTAGYWLFYWYCDGNRGKEAKPA